MNSTDLDTWYDTEKEKLEEKYRAACLKGKSLEKETKRFKQRMISLHKKYERKSKFILKSELITSKVKIRFDGFIFRTRMKLDKYMDKYKKKSKV